MEYITLRDNIKIPVIGFGPGGMGYKPNQSHKRKSRNIFYRAYNKLIARPLMQKNYTNAVVSAIESGFRLIDYSAAYGDGKLIGSAVKASGVKREDLILTTRVSNRAQFSGMIEEEFFRQLHNFGTDYVDILMFHWPVKDIYCKTWQKMIELRDKGFVKILGVANCHAHHINELERTSGVLPVINQFEVHPLFTQKELIKFCREKNIQIESYTPIARFDDRLMRLPALRKIADKYSKSVTQIVLRWHVQNDLIPVVRTLDKAHQHENINIFDFSLTSEELAVIDSVNINSRLRFDPDNCDFTVL